MIFSRSKKTISYDEVTGLLDGLKLPLILETNPINFHAEKEKFLSKSTYSPEFRYKNRSRPNNKDIFKQLQSIERVEGVDLRVSEFLIKLIEDRSITESLLQNVGENVEFTKLSKKKFPKVKHKNFIRATKVLKGYYKKSFDVSEYSLQGDKYDANQIREVVKKVLEHYELSGWKVLLRKSGSNNIKVGSNISIGKFSTKSKNSLKKSLVHEIGTHIFRAHNGLNSGVKLLGKPNLRSYLSVEEGLAIYNEMKMGLLNYSQLKIRALQYFACAVGEDLTFRELFNVLLAHTSKESAFEVAFRVKKGLGDVNMPGVFTKDVVYWDGLLKVKRRLKKRPSDYSKLYAGKISFKQLKWVDEGLIEKPKLILDKDFLDITDKAIKSI